jgi:hypothetical protein
MWKDISRFMGKSAMLRIGDVFRGKTPEEIEQYLVTHVTKPPQHHRGEFRGN